MARHIKSGDQVMVIAGADKGKTGRVLKIVHDKNDSNKNRVIVEGINRVWKHVRPTQRYPQGGRIQKDAAIHISNVQPLDPTTGKGTRVKFGDKDGRKHRIAVGSGTDLGPTGQKTK
ncbi:MAG: 50S ribosomal protein L24 [Phycisphaerae bacterium]|nr:50S ribosomal protein L24 [Phycisphaerae bacterium]